MKDVSISIATDEAIGFALDMDSVLDAIGFLEHATQYNAEGFKVRLLLYLFGVEWGDDHSFEPYNPATDDMLSEVRRAVEKAESAMYQTEQLNN